MAQAKPAAQAGVNLSDPALHMQQNNTPPLTGEQLKLLKQWFRKYVHSYYTADPFLQPDLVLKEKHSRHVAGEIRAIGSQLGLGANGLRIAEAMGLLHDIGRFEQVTRYRTFVDGKSENHAELGIRVLQQEQALASWEEQTRQLVMKAISYHNRLSIPEDESPATLFYSRLLRDADKLDILALFAAYYSGGQGKRSTVVELDLPDEPGISAEVLGSLQQGKAVNMRQLRFFNDFKLLQLAWVYDINFDLTLATLHTRGYLQKIREALPPSNQIDRLYDRLLSYIEDRLRAQRAGAGHSR